MVKNSKDDAAVKTFNTKETVPTFVVDAGDVFRRNVLSLKTPKETRTFSGALSVIRTLEAEAITSGASTFELYGGAVFNNKLFNPSIFQRLGYEYRTAGGGILLTKKLK